MNLQNDNKSNNTIIVKLLPKIFLYIIFLLSLTWAPIGFAQLQGPTLGDGPWVFESYEQDYIKVSVVVRNLNHSWGLAFIPGTATEQHPLGDILFPERYEAKINLYTRGRLLDRPVVDLTEVFSIEQILDIKLHPDFESNRWVYFTYIKTAPHPQSGNVQNAQLQDTKSGMKNYWATTVLARGRFDGSTLTDIEDVYEANAWSGNIGGASARMLFLADKTLLLGVSHRIDLEAPQSLQSDIGKVLRLNDDGSIPKDNPFVGVEGADSQIFTWGNRSVMDIVAHPQTGEIWDLENGPQGGDEVNILKPGLNYGWPIATFGRDYDGTLFNETPWVEGTEAPVVFWVPSITVAGMAFYTGEKFPKWQGNLFVTSMIVGRIPNTGHLERIVLNEQGNGELRREQLLNELKQRIRYVVQGEDDLLYVLTDHSDGALLRLEPTTAQEHALYRDNIYYLVDAPEAAIAFEGFDCQSCHQQENSQLGPSYRDIADKYELNDANIELLANKIINGSSGLWGETPMAPHPNIGRDKAVDMATEILKWGTN